MTEENKDQENKDQENYVNLKVKSQVLLSCLNFRTVTKSSSRSRDTLLFRSSCSLIAEGWE